MIRKIPTFLIFFLALTLTACGDRSEEEQASAPKSSTTSTAASSPGSKPDIFLIVLDACRPDRLGSYGYERNTSPVLDSFANDPDAVQFQRHYVQGTWTKPSTASLFTGQHVYEHGIREGHKKNAGGSGFITSGLSEDHETMAELLKNEGYSTLGVVKTLHLVPKYGFAQGFDAYIDPSIVSGDVQLVRSFLGLAQQSSQPFFGYLHLNACHQPFAAVDRNREFMARYGFPYDERARIPLGIDFNNTRVKTMVNDRGLRLEPDDVRFLSLVYDAKLRSVDERLVAPLFEGLRGMGRFEDALIMITADHGEELYEHEGYAHGHAVWEEVIRVPLIVKFPRGQRPPGTPDEIERVTSSIDLLPTLLDYVGASIPSGLPGYHLLDPKPRPAFSEDVGAWSVITPSLKLSVKNGKPQLFDLASDPHEKTNLAESRPDDVARLQTVRNTFFAGEAVDAPELKTELSPEAIEQLRSLGYME